MVYCVHEVTQLLGIGSTHSYNMGDIIVRPKNDNIINSTVHYRKETAWELSSGYQESYDVNVQLYYFLDRLENKVEELNTIRSKFKTNLHVFQLIR
ncbi:DUF4279 domain-containing protein [Paenibacillus shirakamiensis]|uniref:DUF4279 domain-containing protein n=1 Tax=Paenibacillus shirakamiensis TaxID=1265935 RepID=UPI003CC92C61